MQWSGKINEWIQGPDLATLGSRKKFFFSHQRDWFGIGLDTLPDKTGYWKETTSQYALWKVLLEEIHDQYLWFCSMDPTQPDQSKQEWYPLSNPDFQTISQSLKKIINSFPDK